MKKLALLLVLALLVSFGSAFALNTEGFPIVDEKVSFTMLVGDDYTPEDHALMFNFFEELTNVHVDLMLYPHTAAMERKGVLLTTGNYPEVIGGWLLGSSDIIDNGMNGDIFLPLEDLIAEYAPHIEEVLNIPGVRASMTLGDGHIYSTPYPIGEPQATFKPYINQVWLENLNLEMPTTPEELKDVLIAFRDNDANGNGDPNDEIPFSGDPNNLNLGMLAGWFGVDAFGGGDYPFFSMVDGKLLFSANTDEYREFLEYFADLYDEKLIDPELFTQDLQTWKGKGKEDLYGVSIAYGPGDFFPDYDKETEADKIEKYQWNAFTCLPVLKGCENPIFHRNSYGVTLFRTQMAITNKADEEMAAVILRWFDLLYTEEYAVQWKQGLLGERIEKVADGIYRIRKEWLDNKTEEDELNHQWDRICVYALPSYNHNSKILDWDKDEPDPSMNDYCDEVYGPYLNDTFKQVWPGNEEDAARRSVLATDINTFVKTSLAQFVSGEKELTDESWEAYKAQLETYNLGELTEITARILGCEIY